MSRRWWTFSSVRPIHMVDSPGPFKACRNLPPKRRAQQRLQAPLVASTLLFHCKAAWRMGFSFKGSEGCFFGDVNVTETCLFLQKWAEQVRGLKVSLFIHDFMTIFSKVFETKLHPVCSTCTFRAQTKQKCYWYWHTTQQPPAFHQIPIILAPSTTVRMVQFQYVTISHGQLATSRTLRRSSKAPEGLDKRCKIVDMDRPKGLGVVALESIAAGQQVL